MSNSSSRAHVTMTALTQQIRYYTLTIVATFSTKGRNSIT